jgi:hypothetical protein
MGAVAGADEAGQTPQAADTTRQTQQMAEPAAAASAPATEQAPEQANQATEPAPEQVQPDTEQTQRSPGFGERGRMRRRARFLRKARELAYRDLGGLVFDLHRFGERNDQLVLAKLATLGHIDSELRGLEGALGERRSVTVLREVGIAACPRCAAIHGSDDRFCPGCGLAFDTNADRPISTAPLSPPGQTPAPASPSPATPSQPTSPSFTAPAPSPTFTPPAVTPPSVKPKAPPVAAKPVTPTSSERAEPERTEEDEPTQILRPPATGA